MNNQRMIYLNDSPSSDQMPARVIYGAREACPPPVHWHDNIEINFMVKGSWYINIDGKKKYIGQKHAEIVNSGAVHWITPVKKDAHDNLVVVFYHDFMKQYLPDIDDFIFKSPGEITATDPLYGHLSRLYEIYQGEMPESPAVTLEITGILYALAYELLDHYKVRERQNVRNQNSRYRERFKAACQFIEDNYGEDIGLPELAAELGISREHCSRSFRHYLGVSFKEYLTGVRLAHAYRLLIYSDMPIVEIAMRTGFADIRAFERSFLAMYNETPSGYRRRLREEGSERRVLSGRTTEI